MKFLSDILAKAGLIVDGTTQLNTIANATTDTDKFIVSDGGVIKYRTGAEVLSDIGAASAAGFVPYTGATQDLDLGEYGVFAGHVNLDTTPTGTPTSQGTIYWNDARSTASLIMNGTTQNIGQDSYFYVKNSTGSPIPKGTAVGFAGTDGASGHILISPFIADGSQPSTYFMGVTSEAINNGSFGQVMQFGEMKGFNTSGYPAGSLLYVSSTVAGGFQTTAPIAPNNIILVAATLNSTNNGSIVVRVSIGSNINNDEGVKIVSPVTGQILQLQAGGLWENKTINQAIGYTPADDSLVVHKAGTETITGQKTFNAGIVLPNYQKINLSNSASIEGYDGKVLFRTVYGTAGYFQNNSLVLAQMDNETGTSGIGFLVKNFGGEGLVKYKTAAQALSMIGAQGALTLTTTGTSGAATLVSNTLNIPQYQAQGNYITSLTGEATASGPGAASVTLTNSAVIGKVLTGLNITGGTVLSTDSILVGFGKLQNQVNGLFGGVTYQGTWNASTNTPTLTSSTGTKGHYYIVSVPGSTNLDGVTDWKLGDWAIFNGATWDKVDNTDAVVSVNGFTGAVSLTTTNIAEGTNLYYTDARARGAISLTTTGTSGAATYSGGVFNIPQYQGQITLTTTGSSGAATLVGNTLNIPQYQTALTNPVTGTGTTNYLPKFTGSTTIGNSQLIDDGTTVFLGTTGSLPNVKMAIYSTTQRALEIVSTSGNGLFVSSGGAYVMTVTNNTWTTQFTQAGRLELGGDLSITTIANATTDTDKFLVSDSGVIKYRTGAELLSDIGGQAASSISGTTNYIPKFTGSNSLGNSVIYETSSNIGIGTTSPSEKLHINSSTGNVSALFESTDPISLITFKDNNTTLSTLGLGGVSNNMVFYLDTEKMRLTSTGLGIGTSSPAYKLDVVAAGSSVTSARFSGNNSANNNTQIRIYGANAAADLWAIGNAVGTGDATRNFDIYDLVANANRLRIDASGNIGIGTSSPNTNLEISATVDPILRLNNSTTAVTTGADIGEIQFYTNDASASGTGVKGFIKTVAAAFGSSQGGASLSFGTAAYGVGNATEKMLLDYNGNLGLGVTPSAWSGPANLKAFQIGNGSIFTQDYLTSVNFNTYYDGIQFKYIVSDYATRYRQYQGAHAWHTAPSGTAGNAITFTQAMTLDASGRLGIGTTSPIGNLDVASLTPSLYIRNTKDGSWTQGETVGALNFYTNDVSVIGAHIVSSITSVHDGVSTTAPAGALVFSTAIQGANVVEAMRLNSSGNLLVGTTTALLSASGRGNITINGSSSAILSLGVGGTYSGYLYAGSDKVELSTNAQPMTFVTNGAERMRLTSTGLGIGTSSPDVLLHLSSSTDGSILRLERSATAITSGQSYGQVEWEGQDASTGAAGVRASIDVLANSTLGETNMIFRTSGSNFNANLERMRLDASGNLGLGVTPSAWGSNSKVLQLPSGMVYTYNNDRVFLGQNVFLSPTNVDAYYSNGYASTYRQYQGTHAWYIAPSGTAGNAISFTQAMTLDASGRLGIGTTSPAYKLDVSGSVHTNNEVYIDNGNYLRFQRSSGGLSIQTLGIPSGTDNVRLVTSGDFDITNGALTSLVKVTNGGNVGIGTTSPSATLEVYNATQGNIYISSSGTNASALRFFSGGNELVTLRSLGNGNLAFETGTGSPTERMRITSSGNVGIGTSSPDQALHVKGSIQSGETGSDGVFLWGRSADGLAAASIEYATTGTIFTINQGSNGPLAFKTNATERMRITSGGDVLIGTTSTRPDEANDEGRALWGNGKQFVYSTSDWFVGNSNSEGSKFSFRYYGSVVGDISITSTETSFNTSSDYRLKQDLKDFNGLSLVNNIKVYDYQWKANNTRSYGVMAHELQTILPNAVTGVKDGEQMQGVDYSKIVPVLVKAIQELKAEIQTLKN